jgi:hypothetical protein
MTMSDTITIERIERYLASVVSARYLSILSIVIVSDMVIPRSATFAT